MPVTITRPRAARMVSTAATKGAPSPSDIAAASAATPSASVSSVRSAEAMWGFAAGFGLFAPDALIFERVLTRNSRLPFTPPRQYQIAAAVELISPKPRRRRQRRGRRAALFPAREWRDRH